MRIPGERFKRTRLVQTERYVVAVKVEMVVPEDDPNEPCYEAETVKLLREVKRRAERDDLDWLQRHGKVYVALLDQPTLEVRIEKAEQEFKANKGVDWRNVRDDV